MPLTVDEAVELYPDEWMLMQVTELEQGVPSRGLIVAHTKTRDAIQATVIETLTSAKRTGKKYYLFCGFHRLHSAEEWRDALAREEDRLRR